MGALLEKLGAQGYRATEELERQVLAALNTRPTPGRGLPSGLRDG